LIADPGRSATSKSGVSWGCSGWSDTPDYASSGLNCQPAIVEEPPISMSISLKLGTSLVER
jgi:hypothetical protein